MLFISHALPEDNEFTRWLALRLAKEGYPVWCELTKLLGGEDFWRDIQDAIKNRATKFLFVYSRHSNDKPGVLQELSLAKRVGKDRHDFVIPLKIDDLSNDETNIELVRINSVDFSQGWTAGLARLLEKLEKDQVPKDPRFNPGTVASWWRDQQRQQGGVKPVAETCASNWFKISDLPESIYLHSLEVPFTGEEKELPIGIPNYRYKGGFFCFEAAPPITARLRDEHHKTVTQTQELSLSSFQRWGYSHLKIDKTEARNIVTNLLRRAFEMRCIAAGLKEYSLAGDAKCFLFPEDNANAEAYRYDPDFHHQLKGRLLKHGILTQLVLETTIAHMDFLKANGKLTHQLDNLQSQIAWNLSSAVYYKIGGRPWKLDGVRPGVCYIGLVFKQDSKSPDSKTACCAAQMFLDSGDGVVFKGHTGHWYSERTGEYHLDTATAYHLLDQAIQSYKAKHAGTAPKEVFIHGRTRFSDEEWQSFRNAAGKDTQLTGVRIYEADRFRLYRPNSTIPVMRGLAWVQSETQAILMSRGYLPSLGTYPGQEVPRPLEVEICQGEADIRQVQQDVLGLTKLNYNSCRFADGQPVTLKFADAVGEVLISGPNAGDVPLPFKHYI